MSADFPDFVQMVVKSSVLLLAIPGMSLAFLFGFVFLTAKVLNMEYLKVFTFNPKHLNWHTELLFFGIMLYFFASLPAYIILHAKTQQCDNFDPPFKSLISIFVVQLGLFVTAFIVQKMFSTKLNGQSDKTLLFALFGFIFIVAGIMVTYIANMSLSTDDSPLSSQGIISIVATIVYLLLRGSLYYGGCKEIGWSAFFIFGTIYFSISIASMPWVVKAYLSDIASTTSICN